MIITPKQPRDDRTTSRLGKLVPYVLREKGEERCTWYMPGNLEGIYRREEAALAIVVTRRGAQDSSPHITPSLALVSVARHNSERA